MEHPYLTSPVVADPPIETRLARPFRFLLEHLEAAADWSGIDPDTMIGLVLYDWLVARGLAHPLHRGPLPTVDWSLAYMRRSDAGTGEEYRRWRENGQRLLDSEPSIGGFIAPQGAGRGG